MRTLLILVLSTALLSAGGWRKPTPKALDRYSASDQPIIVYLKDSGLVRPAIVIKNWDNKGDELPLTFRVEGAEVPMSAITCWQPFPKPPKR